MQAEATKENAQTVVAARASMQTPLTKKESPMNGTANAAPAQSPRSPKAMAAALEDIGLMAHDSFTSITSLCDMALLALESPRTYSAGGLEHLAQIFALVKRASIDGRDCILYQIEPFEFIPSDIHAMNRANARELARAEVASTKFAQEPAHA